LWTLRQVRSQRTGRSNYRWSFQWKAAAALSDEFRDSAHATVRHTSREDYEKHITDILERRTSSYPASAEGLGLPVIYTCEESVWNAKKTHFDTNHMVTIIWNPASLAAAADNLTATIRATFRSEAKQTDD
jgi:hypothetical protein